MSTTTTNESAQAAAFNERVVVVDQVSVAFPSRSGSGEVVRSVSFSVKAGARVGLVGESGSGKSLTARAIMRLIPPPGRQSSGRVLFNGVEIGTGALTDPTQWRGTSIAMITQDPL
jgi:ABC-type glutathione transport system ATPase component